MSLRLRIPSIIPSYLSTFGTAPNESAAFLLSRDSIQTIGYYVQRIHKQPKPVFACVCAIGFEKAHPQEIIYSSAGEPKITVLTYLSFIFVSKGGMIENFNLKKLNSTIYLTSLAWDVTPYFLRGLLMAHHPTKQNLSHSMYDYSAPLSTLQPTEEKNAILQKVRRAANSWEAQERSSKSQILKLFFNRLCNLHVALKKAGRREKEKTKKASLARLDELAKEANIQGVSAQKKRKSR